MWWIGNVVDKLCAIYSLELLADLSYITSHLCECCCTWESKSWTIFCFRHRLFHIHLMPASQQYFIWRWSKLLSGEPNWEIINSYPCPSECIWGLNNQSSNLQVLWHILPGQHNDLVLERLFIQESCGWVRNRVGATWKTLQELLCFLWQ